MTIPRWWKDFWRLIGFLRPHSTSVLLSVLLASSAAASGIALFGTSAYLLATAALHPSVAALEVAIVGVRFFGISRAVNRYLERLVSHSVNFHLLAGLRVRFYRVLEPLAPARLVHSSSGDLLSRSIADIETLENFYIRAVAPSLTALLEGLGAAFFISRYDFRFGILLGFSLVIACIVLPVVVFLSAREPGKAVVDQRAQLNILFQDTVQGMADLTLFNRQADHIERILQVGRRLRNEQERLGRVAALGNAGSILISGLVLFPLLLVAVPLVGRSISGVDLAVVSLIALASFEVATPLIQAAQQLGASLRAARRLFDLEAVPPAVAEQVAPLAVPDSMHLSIRDLTFTYSSDLPPALSNISLELPPGKSIALVGPSGAGKSTVLKLLLRFLDFDRGMILLEGHDIRRFLPDAVRSKIAYIPQNTYLFSGTLRQNLLLASPGAETLDLQSAVIQAGLAEWVAQLPQGLDTWIGERGLMMSGGERQRLAIARALLRKAQLFLFDEPASHLDAEREQELLDMMRSASAGCSAIWVTHRLTGLETMDEIIVLDRGRIVERGTHTSLLVRNGAYARMWQIQQQMLWNFPAQDVA